MARSEGSPFGKLTGKLGSAVGFGWKGINAVRSYAIPANPKTDAQKAQRLMMTRLVAIARTLLLTVCHKFWNPGARNMSGFNAFIKSNLDRMYPEWDPEILSLCEGGLEGIQPTSAVKADVDNTVEIEWSATIQSNGLAGDFVVGVIYDEITQMAFISDTHILRSAASMAITVPATLRANTIWSYVFCYRVVDGALAMQSGTTPHQVTTT